MILNFLMWSGAILLVGFIGSATVAGIIKAVRDNDK